VLKKGRFSQSNKICNRTGKEKLEPRKSDHIRKNHDNRNGTYGALLQSKHLTESPFNGKKDMKGKV